MNGVSLDKKLHWIKYTVCPVISCHNLGCDSEVNISEKCHTNMDPVLSCLGAVGIWRMAWLAAKITLIGKRIKQLHCIGHVP